LLALVAVVNLAALAYRYSEGWDWGNCYWMVVITLSTLGFSDSNTKTLSANGRIITTLLIVAGFLVVQLTVQGFLALSESGYFRQLREQRFRSRLQRMQNHVILCGYGRIGREIAEQLIREGVPLLVVETDPECREAAEERGLPVLMADATLDVSLLEAGNHRCPSLVAALPGNAAGAPKVKRQQRVRAIGADDTRLDQPGQRQGIQLAARTDNDCRVNSASLQSGRSLTQGCQVAGDTLHIGVALTHQFQRQAGDTQQAVAQAFEHQKRVLGTVLQDPFGERRHVGDAVLPTAEQQLGIGFQRRMGVAALTAIETETHVAGTRLESGLRQRLLLQRNLHCSS
jgi:hypothetical protein